VRRRVFLSYHHANDQPYYDEFARFFHDGYEALYDNSLERQIDSDNVNYVIQRIRDAYITSTSCTIVLLGAETPQRKYVDWEIKATLDKEHGLLGIVLPTCRLTANGSPICPTRFVQDYARGHAKVGYWKTLTVEALRQLVEAAVSAPASLIDNSHPMMQRNGS
jgi:hypothetical protein